MKKNKALALSCLHMAIAIILGAFGAHQLKLVLSPMQLDSFKTGVEYHIYHALALLVLNSWQSLNPKVLRSVNILMNLGILLFCGSIYLLSTRDITGLSALKLIGPVTPLGGLCFILAWFYLSWHFIFPKK